ncbi:hypothetical protein [Lewinella sp. IMCC34183]|uniref:hypothetical protein n=1 Tax=Lewinella sp. IMCC34183 TaxID=2248762 RepID=UPI001300787C|nr:hypothetical protein [Lewinella sp. IMCC34183]
MRLPEDIVSESDLERSWEKIFSIFDLMIENGYKLRPIRSLIRYVIEKGYSKYIYAGTSYRSLLISLPSDMALNFTKTLRIQIDQNRSVVNFVYNCKVPRSEKPEFEYGCQLTEIIDTFEWFIQSHEDWTRITYLSR